jgi:hypothetical protein
MMICALILASLGTPAAMSGNRLADFDLGVIAAETPVQLLTKRTLRSPYRAPDVEQPSNAETDIQLRWKLNKVKLTMPLPSI